MAASECSGLLDVRPVQDGGDAAAQSAGRAQQVAGVDVCRTEELSQAQHRLEVIHQVALGQHVAQHRFPHMAVGVDQAGNDNAAGGVDDLVGF